MRLSGSGCGRGGMADGDRDDRIIREHEVRRSINIDLSDSEIPEREGDQEER